MNPATETPIADAVAAELGWSPEQLGPPFDLEAFVSASYDRPRPAAPAAVEERDSTPRKPAPSRGRSPRPKTASTRKAAPRRTTTKKPGGDGDA